MRTRLIRLVVVVAVASTLVAAPGSAAAMTLSAHNAGVVLVMVDDLLAEQLPDLRTLMVEAQWNQPKFQPIALDALERTTVRLEQLRATLLAATEDEKVPQGRAHGQWESAFALYPAQLLTSIKAIEAIATAGDQVEEAFEEIGDALDPMPMEEICDNNLDDDGDGFVDSEDPDCLREVP